MSQRLKRGCFRDRFALVVLGVCGCVGPLTEPEVPAPPPPPSAEARASLVFPGEDASLAPRRLWRLTSSQLEAQVEAALGTIINWGDARLFDAVDEAYANHQSGMSMPGANVHALLEMGDRVAEALAEDEACAGFGCDEAGLEVLLHRLHRGRAPDATVERGRALLQRLEAAGFPAPEAFGRAAGWSLGAVGVLFRTEVGAAPAERVVLTPLEQASGLAYLLWGEGPPEDLIRAAQNGALDSPEEVEAKAREMARDPRFARHLGRFLAQWLGYEHLDGATKSSELFPFFDDDHRRQLQVEIDAFVARVLEGDGSLVTLLSTQEGFQTSELPETYAGDEVEGGRTLTRAGLVLLPGVLAARSGSQTTKSMTRAARILERLFCIHLPEPDNVDLSVLPDPDEANSERERFEVLAETPSCSGCHRLLNPVAFAFERYDPAGRYRKTTEGEAIDPSGELGLGVEPVGSFSDAVEFMTAAASSVDVQACFVRQAFGFSFGLDPGPEHDPWMREAFSAFEDAGYALEELFVAFARSNFFRFRGRLEGDR